MGRNQRRYARIQAILQMHLQVVSAFTAAETSNEVKLPSMANSLYLDMLTDKQRNSAYCNSIKQVVQLGIWLASKCIVCFLHQVSFFFPSLSSKSGVGIQLWLNGLSQPPNSHALCAGSKILDIGTGTGFLGMMAAHAIMQSGEAPHHSQIAICHISALT